MNRDPGYIDGRRGLRNDKESFRKRLQGDRYTQTRPFERELTILNGI